MKKNAVLLTVLVVVLVIITSSVVISSNNSGNNDSSTASVIDSIKSFFGAKTTGNGAPSGAHTNLNIIGVKNKGDESAYKDGGGKVIFVPLLSLIHI